MAWSKSESISGLVLILLLSTTLCSGMSCITCSSHDTVPDEACETGPWDEFHKPCCPLQSNPGCYVYFQLAEDKKVKTLSRRCSARPVGQKQEPGCKPRKDVSGDDGTECWCFDDNCNNVNPMKPDEVDGFGSASTPTIQLWTFILATFPFLFMQNVL